MTAYQGNGFSMIVGMLGYFVGCRWCVEKKRIRGFEAVRVARRIWYDVSGLLS